MTDVTTGSGASDLPQLLLPEASPVEYSAGTARGQRLRTPSRERQRTRLEPRFEALQQALDAQRLELQDSLIGAEPEQVLVLEVVGDVARFNRAVVRAGLEFLLEVEDEDAEPDDDFAREDRADAEVRQTLYLVLTNQAALNELLRLWRLYRDGEPLPRGFTPFRDVFTQLRDIRPWGPQDRIAHTGLLDEWRFLRQTQTASIPVEIELWHRRDATRQDQAEAAITTLVAAAGGQVVSSYRHDEIAYHAVLAELPPPSVDAVLTDGADAIALARADAVLFLRPVGQIATPFDEGAESREGDFRPTAPAIDAPPVVAILDGLPLEQHEALADRLIVDDPDGWATGYPAGSRRHGTAMCSLVLHGDLSDPAPPITRRVYVRPLLRPDGRSLDRGEVMPPDVLPVDLMLRAVRRMHAGDGTSAPVAAEARVINLSIGDPAAPFDRIPSPWARALDWLSWTYGVLFVASAGNHRAHLDFGASFSDLRAMAPDARQGLALKALAADAPFRRLLSPAEALNALTVGAQHSDASDGATPAHLVDLVGDSELPSPISALGRGIRRAVKPDVLLPGGRQLYDMVTTSAAECRVRPARISTAPGQQVASPIPAGSRRGTAFHCGTSNAAALATGLAARLSEQLIARRAEPGGDQLDDEHLAVLLKAMVVHAADWQRGAGILTAAFPPWAPRRSASRLFGYGFVDGRRVEFCDAHRVVLLGTGTLLSRSAERRSMPLPPGLSGVAGRRRLTYTLAWMSPINPRDKRYRRARLSCTPDLAPLVVARQQVDDKAARRGTVQHEIFEGTGAIPIVDGDELSLEISCAPDAGELTEAIPYGLVVSLEVAPELGVQVYQEVTTRIQPLVQVVPQSQ